MRDSNPKMWFSDSFLWIFRGKICLTWRVQTCWGLDRSCVRWTPLSWLWWLLMWSRSASRPWLPVSTFLQTTEPISFNWSLRCSGGSYFQWMELLQRTQSDAGDLLLLGLHLIGRMTPWSRWDPSFFWMTVLCLLYPMKCVSSSHLTVNGAQN